MGAKERVSCAQVQISADARGDDGGWQVDSNSCANVTDMRTSLSSLRLHDEDCLIASPVLNKFQVLRDLRENYPCSDGELSCCDQPLSPSVVPVLFRDGDTYYFFLSKESQGVICVHSKEKAWERFSGG